MKRGLTLLASAVLATIETGLGTGCVSMSSLQTARTLETGKFEQAFGGGVYSSEAIDSATGVTTSWPYLEYAARYGFYKNWDAGVKFAFPGSYSADAKYQLLANDKLALSTGLGVNHLSYTVTSGTVESKYSIIDFVVPVHFSYDVSKSFTPYITPKYMLRSVSGPEESTRKSLIGASIGAKIGQTSGAFIEATYMAQPGSSYKAMQYNIAYFWQ